MTPKQKKLQIVSIRTIIEAFGLHEDLFENYLLRSDGTRYRIKIMSNNVRAERKAAGRDGRWLCVWSVPIVRLELDQLTGWLAMHPADK